MDGAQRFPLGVELQRPVAVAGEGLGEDAGRRSGRQAVDGLFVDTSQPAELTEAPIVHVEAGVVANRKQQPVSRVWARAELGRGMPTIEGSLLPRYAVRVQLRKR